MFFRGSRYEQVPTQTYETPDGRIISYKSVREIPPTPAQSRHVVDEGERLDQIAFEHFRDAERFWRICDTNTVVWPDELTSRVGRIIDIPTAEG